MAKEITIPGGKAFFREKYTGRGIKLMRSAGLSAASNLSEYPELFEPARRGESEEERTERLGKIKLRIDPIQAQFWDNMREATVLASLESWTLDLPLPTSTEELEELDGDLYEALLDAVGGMSAKDLETNFNPTGEKLDPNSPLDEQSPTTGSESSSGPSSESPLLGSMETPSTGGSPISGESSSPAL